MTDAVGDDWQYRTTVGWFLALPLVASLAVWFAFESPLAVPLALGGVSILVGYGRRILVASVVDPSLPAVDDWLALVRSTAVGAVIVAALVGVPTAVAAVTVASAASPVAPAVSELAAAAIVGTVFVATAYLTPAALAVSGAQSAGGDHPREADRRAIGAIVTSRDYVVATLQAILVLFTVGAAVLMLAVTVFGLVFLPAVVFLAVVLIARRYAYAIERALAPSVIEGLEERTMPWL